MLLKKISKSLNLIFRILLFIKKDTLREEKLNNFINLFTITLYRKFFNNFHLTLDKVEKKYDRVAGIDISLIRGDKITTGYYYVDGKIKKTDFKKNYNKKSLEYCQVLSNYKFKNILEVGAGEFSTLNKIIEYFGTDKEYYAIDLSKKRLDCGLKNTLKLFGNINLKIKKANATAIPFEDNYFDLVYTSHCLEQMPYDYKEAINEMIRVSKETIILFEPSYKLGALSQKAYIRNADYVRGISRYIKSLKQVKLLKHFSLENSDYLNRTACYIIKKLD